MRKPGGTLIITTPNGEQCQDTFTCSHCNSIVVVLPGKKPDEFGSWCTLCMKMHCAKPHCHTCVPFEKKVERMEASYHARRSYG